MVKHIKWVPLSIILTVSALIAYVNPLNMTLEQSLLFSSLICSAALWATEAVHKSLACLFFLIMIAIFGKTNMVDIISFVWSDTNVLIMTTMLLSVGIMNTGIVHQYVEKIFKKSATNKIVLLSVPYLFGLLFIFLVPQAFARVIIIGTILNGLLVAKTPQEERAKQAIIFNGFIGVVMTYMFFNNGDIVLNQAALTFAGEHVKQRLTFEHWFALMSVPTLIASIVTIVTVYIVFKKDLSYFHLGMIAPTKQNEEQIPKRNQSIVLLTMVAIIFCWMTYGWHSIPAFIPAVAGVLVMYGGRVIGIKDLKAINPHFVLFLMTVFSIGKVLGQSGITAIIFQTLKQFIPVEQSNIYLLMITLIVMVLHLCIGSSVATMSVVLPILLPLTQEVGYRPEIITLMTYIIVNIHFLLPFHQATVMIGTAKQYYSEKYMLRFGMAMTVVTFILLAFVYMIWWKIVHIL
ncbi:hypothetical protein GMA11_00945 [Granulicatella sp. zg-ZJ]|uniref:SLC13 family permease n=1 Tax=Granulicatella sp. zg-ZJ TaxID=2678504 RepID=UPI0013D62C18|nr:SLC13 family permease [Granulicatella sp. zg-ZJ]NEW61950.1 hypothetical protein [Granulicatella sp. zg-ZJ]